MSKKRKGNVREANSRRTSESAGQPASRPVVERAEAADQEAMARTYLPESLLIMLLCLTPVAIPAVLYGLAARQASHEGDRATAEVKSEMARKWFIFAVCFGVTINVAILGGYLISTKG